ncbi:hypothetical protein CANCADRAFT_2163 [Tortispora caseinolytica NRRL Y-17796]|uniref:Glucose-6-phosphate 1-epimerase n=1 Tax=Tortispora caseinolytica NRRL Y-17796 TaxID=767744 RepID=A0A1E4TF85_9ASCO|nr:hypothetical protein CANCADRAFT_2163 [Tortispora caseinolytica NRRL Y-17796]
MTIEDLDDKVVIKLDDGAAALEVLYHGATITSWKVNGKEKLFLSDKAVLDGSKAVRGGIPLVFPIFGKPTTAATEKLPQHGFARLSRWEFLGQTSSSPVAIQFGLGPENVPQTLRDAWPVDFTLIYTITLGEDYLTTSMSIENTSNSAFDCQFLFHTYLRVPDIATVSVRGLDGVDFTDKVTGSSYHSNAADTTIAGEVDRMYSAVTKTVSVKTGTTPLFEVNRVNLPDVVLWNPWSEVARNMVDFAPEDGYKQMLCIEPGYVAKWITLNPEQKFDATQTIRAL